MEYDYNEFLGHSVPKGEKGNEGSEGKHYISRKPYYDEDGVFIPYSTIISFESEHRALNKQRTIDYRSRLPYDAMGDYEGLNIASEANLPLMRAEENSELVTCLNNVLDLAEARIEQLTTPDYTEQEIDISDVSIRAIKSFLYKIENSNIILAKDKGNE